MAKKIYRKRYYRKKGKWSANISVINNKSITASSGYFYSYIDLCQNPAQNTTSVSQQYTVKNIELSYEIDIANIENINIETLTAYIIYVPQGMSLTIDYANQHPEYIMAYRYLGKPVYNNYSTNTGRNAVKIKTRLSRRLQTGDKVILYLNGYNGAGTTYYLKFHGLIRWWTKAN